MWAERQTDGRWTTHHGNMNELKKPRTFTRLFRVTVFQVRCEETIFLGKFQQAASQMLENNQLFWTSKEPASQIQSLIDWQLELQRDVTPPIQELVIEAEETNRSMHAR